MAEGNQKKESPRKYRQIPGPCVTVCAALERSCTAEVARW
jgi:hypothetical protein